MMLSSLSLVAMILTAVGSTDAFTSSVAGTRNRKSRIYSAPSSLSMTNNDSDSLSNTTPTQQQTRRSWLQTSASSLVIGSGLAFAAPAFAREVTDASSGELPDLPPEAIRSYLQYRFGLQLAADYYMFDLQTMVADTDEYGSVNDLVASKGGRGGQGGASRIEREYVNPMRIIGLSMPPDYADEIRDSQFAFEKAMSKLTKATNGIRRDLPVEIDATAVPKAKEAWEEGRLALNSFFVTLNTVTGLKDELTVIPPPGPNQLKEYGRNIRRYNEFMKKTKQCQNRGGPTLSAAWGQLMVSGYLQDACGVEPLGGYFFQ